MLRREKTRLSLFTKPCPSVMLKSQVGQQQGRIGRLTKRFGGMATARDSQLVNENNYVEDDIYLPVSDEQALDFRQYMERKKEVEKKTALSGALSKTQDAEAGTPPYVGELSEKTWLVAVDSEHRDSIVYPDAAEFKTFLGRTFENVTSVELMSIEFPNADTTVCLRNNVIAWINEEDADLGFPVYKVVVPPGTYTTAESLAEAMSTKLNSPKNLRRGGAPGSAPHRFLVDLGITTDVVSLTSLIPINAPVNPFNTTSDSTTITVKVEDHGFQTNDTVHISGAIGYVGGIVSTELNDLFQITVVDEDSFTIVCASPASTESSGGGPWVSIGRLAPFQLIFGEVDKNISSVIGYAPENSSEFVNKVFEDANLTSIILPDPTTGVVETIDVLPGFPTRIVCPSHRLVAGDKVRLYNTHLLPNIYDENNPDGVFDVIQIVSPDVFAIDWETFSVVSVSTAYIGTRIMQLTFPTITPAYLELFPSAFRKRFNRVTRIESMPVDPLLVFPVYPIRVTTLFSHGLRTDETVSLGETNSTPAVDGSYVATYLEDDAFQINLTEPLSATGFRGTIGLDHEFRLYNAKAVGGFRASDINAVPLKVREIIDENNVLFTVKSGFSSSSVSGGGENLRISSKIHGFAGVQKNSISRDERPYRPVNLAGSNYCFLTVPTFGRFSGMLFTGGVKNIFAKLLLTDAPGNFIFNSAVASPLRFTPSPLQRLQEIDFLWVDRYGYTLTFAGLEWSCTIAITCRVQQDDRNYQPSVVVLPAMNKRTTRSGI